MNKKNKYISLLFLTVIVCGYLTAKGKSDFSEDTDQVYNLIKDKLYDTDIPDSYLTRLFSDPRIREHKKISRQFANPYEKKEYSEYRNLFVKDSKIEKGIQFYEQYDSTFSAAADSFNVDPLIILSILGVESNFGSNHKQYSVVNAYYTIIKQIPKRKAWAVKELAEFIKYCHQDSVPPFSISGSYAGAFGYGQFIPSSFNNLSIDFDKDGVREPYGWSDVIGSIAYYLSVNGFDRQGGYKKDSPAWKSIWSYNHSENYVRVIIDLRDEYAKKLL